MGQLKQFLFQYKTQNDSNSHHETVKVGPVVEITKVTQNLRLKSNVKEWSCKS